MTSSERVLRQDHDSDIFVSYRRTDKAFVEQLVPVLEGLGASVWWDAEIEGGEDWRDSIVENLAASRCLVIVFSEACNTSEQLKKELAVADHLNKDVIPVLIEQTEPRGFFLYELARLNWISIHPSPMKKLDSVARLLVERLEAAGRTPLSMGAPADLAPQRLSASADGAVADGPSFPGHPAVAPLAPPVAPETAHEAGTAGVAASPGLAPDVHVEPVAAAPPVTALPPPRSHRSVPPSPTAGAGALPTVPDLQRLRPVDVFPFRLVDFILPTLVGVLSIFGREEGDDVGVIVGTALLGFVLILAITGLILFPIRYYRRRSNPHRVARNLVISNLSFAVVGSLAGFLMASSVKEEGETVNETRAYLAAGTLAFGLLIAVISFVTFILLSRHRARKIYEDGFERL